MSSPLCGVAVINAIVFGVYGTSMRYLKENTLTNHFLAGMFAGTVQSVISCPMELAKTKIQLQGILGPDPMEAIKTGFALKQKPPLYKSPIDCLWKLYSDGGKFRFRLLIIAQRCAPVPLKLGCLLREKGPVFQPITGAQDEIFFGVLFGQY